MQCLRQIILVCILINAAGEASGATAKTTWTTYLYQGPGNQYAVIDEIPQASTLTGAQCSSGWCKVTLGNRIGYVKSEVVAFGDPSHSAPGLLPQPAASLNPKPSGPCVKANQTGGNGGNAMTVFCRK